MRKRASEAVPNILDEIAREGARRMLVVALKEEVTGYLARHADERDANGHRMVVRNGKARRRRVTLGCGTVDIKAPRVNNRRIKNGKRQRFTSNILPPYMRRSPKVSEALPVLYLRGLSTGDLQEALPLLLGEEATAGLSPTMITRMTDAWTGEYHAFRKRDLSKRDYV